MTRPAKPCSEPLPKQPGGPPQRRTTAFTAAPESLHAPRRGTSLTKEKDLIHSPEPLPPATTGPHAPHYRPTYAVHVAHMHGATGPHARRMWPTYATPPAHMRGACGPHAPGYRPTCTVHVTHMHHATGPHARRMWPTCATPPAHMHGACGPPVRRHLPPFPANPGLQSKFSRPPALEDITSSNNTHFSPVVAGRT